MAYDLALETEFVKRFVHSAKQERSLSFISQGRTRPKFINELGHHGLLNMDLFERTDGHEQDAIRRAVAGLKGVTTAYVISENALIDGRRLELEEALMSALSPWADTSTLLVFGHADLVYYETEGLGQRWLSKLDRSISR